MKEEMCEPMQEPKFAILLNRLEKNRHYLYETLDRIRVRLNNALGGEPSEKSGARDEPVIFLDRLDNEISLLESCADSLNNEAKRLESIF